MIIPRIETCKQNTVYMVTNNTISEYRLFSDMSPALETITKQSCVTNATIGIIDLTTEPKSLEQHVFIKKDGQHMSHVDEIIDEKTTRSILKKYNWANPDLRFLRCQYCGKIPNITYMQNGITRYAVRCSDGCFRQTKLFDSQREAVNAWSKGEIFTRKESTAADKELSKWIILENKHGEHKRYYIGSPDNYPDKNKETDWQDILEEIFDENDYDKSATPIKPNAIDMAHIFNDAMEDQNHHYLTSMFMELHNSIIKHTQNLHPGTITDEIIQNILKDTYNSFVTTT